VDFAGESPREKTHRLDLVLDRPVGECAEAVGASAMSRRSRSNPRRKCIRSKSAGPLQKTWYASGRSDSSRSRSA
jgi:hypothetical protein